MAEKLPSRIIQDFVLPPLAKRIMRTTALSALALVAACNSGNETKQTTGEVRAMQEELRSLNETVRMQSMIAEAAGSASVVYSPDGRPETNLSVMKRKQSDDALFQSGKMEQWQETLKTMLGKSMATCTLAQDGGSIACTTK